MAASVTSKKILDSVGKGYKDAKYVKIIKDQMKEILSEAGPVTAKTDWNTDYAFNAWPNKGAKNKNKQIVLKSSYEVIEKIIDVYSTDGDFNPQQIVKPPQKKIKIKVVIDDQHIVFESTGAALGKEKKVSATTMTAMQELGSAWIFKKAIQDDHTFNKWEDIKTDDNGKTFKELTKIWRGVSGKKDIEVTDDWIKNFYAQNKRLVQELGKKEWTTFTRGKTKGYTASWYTSQNKSQGTFMEWVSAEVKNRFNIAKKDNWNPADVWLIYEEQKWRDQITEAMKTPTPGRRQGAVAANLAQFNAIFRKLFKDHKVVGLSLKKTTADIAEWKLVNTSEKFFKQIESIEMEYDGAKCFLNTKDNGTKLGTQDTLLWIKDAKTTYEVQIKATNSQAFDNLKYEPKDLKNKGARMGKATSVYVDDLVETYVPGGQSWKRAWQDYPQELTGTKGFNEDEQRKYKSMIENLITKGVKVGDVTADEAVNNLKTIFKYEPHVVNSKLMQITWLDGLLRISSSKNRDKFCTDLIFLAEKAGRRYGPYAKLY